MEYEKRAKCLIKQYNNFCITEIDTNVGILNEFLQDKPFKSFFHFDQVNGTKTLDENIADNVGLLLTYSAYQMHIAEHGADKILPGFDKFTQDQLFFIAYGNVRILEQIFIQSWLN